MKYPEERKANILKKLQPPYSRTIAQLADEEGISIATLYLWRKQARAAGQLMPDDVADPEGWSSRDKFNAVLETASLSEQELAEYCRRKGLYPEQIRRWRAQCEKANAMSREADRKESESLREERKRSKALERELRRKEKALAETAALLTLRKQPRRSGGTRRYDQHPRSPHSTVAGQ